MYPGFTQSLDPVQSLIDGMRANGFAYISKTQKSANQTLLQFGAKTINNLPLLMEIGYPAENGAMVLFKVPVLPLKPLLEEAISYILGHR